MAGAGLQSDSICWRSLPAALVAAATWPCTMASVTGGCAGVQAARPSMSPIRPYVLMLISPRRSDDGNADQPWMQPEHRRVKRAAGEQRNGVTRGEARPRRAVVAAPLDGDAVVHRPGEQCAEQDDRPEIAIRQQMRQR